MTYTISKYGVTRVVERHQSGRIWSKANEDFLGETVGNVKVKSGRLRDRTGS